MSGAVIRLKINNQTVEARPGMTVLECARSYGIYIPSLCNLEGLPAFAGCRLCLVEIVGRPQPLPACQMLAEEGLEVNTSSPKLEALRLSILELILSEHPYFCLLCQEKSSCQELKVTMTRALEPGGCVFCPKDGSCELQRVASYLQIKKVSYDFNDRGRSLWQSDPFIAHNPNLCLLCGRCLRACAEVRGENVLNFIGRGSELTIGTFFGRSLKESGCSFCGACLDVCPVAAFSERGISTLKGREIYEKFFICLLCSSACELKAEFLDDCTIRRIVPASGSAAAPGPACARGRFGLKEIFNGAPRALLPASRKSGERKTLSWDQALAGAAESFKKYKPEEVTFIAGAGAAADSLSGFYSLGKMLGTENLFYYDPCDFQGKLNSFENRKGITIERKIDLREIDRFQTFVLVASDPLSEGLALWLEIKKNLRRGARLLVLDSGLNRSGQTADVHLRCRPGKELFTLLGLTKKVVAASAGLNFYRGYGQLLEILEAFSAEELVVISGLETEKLERAAALLVSSSPPLFIFGERLIRQADWENNLIALWNLCLKSEGRLLPVSGSANELLVEGLKRRYSLIILTDFLELTRRVRTGKIKALYLLGEVPLEEKPEFLVVQKPFETGAAEIADIYLPSASFLERSVPVVDLVGRIKKSRTGGEDLRKRPMADMEIIDRLAETLKVGRACQEPDFLESLLKEDRGGMADRTPVYLPFSSIPKEGGAIPELSTVKVSEEFAVIVERNFDSYSGLVMAAVSENFRAVSNPDWLWLNDQEGRALGLSEGQKVILETPAGPLKLEIKLSPLLSPGSAVINPVLDNSLTINLYTQGIIKGSIRVDL